MLIRGVVTRWASVFAVAMMSQAVEAQTYSEKVLYQFCSQPNCADGANPYAGVIRDAAGNLYGTTYYGGEVDSWGVVYKLRKSGLKVLHAFTSGADGYNPYAGLVRDQAGNLFGTTIDVQSRAGATFELDASGNLTILGPGGRAGLILDVGGNLFITPSNEILELSPPAVSDAPWSQTVLYTFAGRMQGQEPNGVIRDPAGNFYGTAVSGGAFNAGVVFELSHSGQESVLYSFTGGSDGANPLSGVIRDPQGNLYGTTFAGGAANQGVVFKIDPSGAESVLYSFTGLSDGGQPHAGLVRDPAGNLYGTAVAGGSANAGVVFKIDRSGHETVLYSFTGGTDGGQPYGGLIRDGHGNLYGTTFAGGNAACSAGPGCGVIFELEP